MRLSLFSFYFSVIHEYMIYAVVIEKSQTDWLDDYSLPLLLAHLLKRDHSERLYLVMDYPTDGQYLVMDYPTDGLYLAMDYPTDWFFLLSGCLSGWHVGPRTSRAVTTISFSWTAEITSNKYFVFCFKGLIFIKV